MTKLQRIFLALALAGGALVLISLLGLTQPARAAAAPSDCLSCHGKSDLSTTLPSGETLSLYVSNDTFAHSAHGAAGLTCQACHADITAYPHPKLQYTTHRELSRAFYQACQKCHPADYEKTLDSMHAKAAAAGNLEAPVCTDCHGAHDTQAIDPQTNRAQISLTCGRCHTQISEQYRASVHGAALTQQNNPDVPVCIDCHGVHNIQDPRLAQFRVASPEMCANCHADPARMSKYNLSTDVYSLYNLSWHGVDVTVYKARWPTIWHESAVCTDCHGVHDIRPTSDAASKVNPANLLATCQKCHPDAGPNWTGAWTGHNRISQQRTPFLYYTNVFYESFTPVILWGSALYVVLQIIRQLVARVKRSLE